MHRLLVLPVLWALTLGTLSHAHETVAIDIARAFIPTGFDDNDVSQVVVVGHLPNTCYKIGPTKFSVDEASKTVTLRQLAYRFSDTPCLEVLIPYMQVVNLGILGAAQYRVSDESSSGALGTLSVLRATSPGPDDHLYAPVTEAYVQTQTSQKTHTLVLTGHFSDRCTTMKEVKVTYYPEIIVVQPIAERSGTNDAGPCAPQPTRFSYSVPLDPTLHGVKLLHVRVMDGQALNRIADLP